MKFKIEAGLLIIAIVLFVVAMFFYSHTGNIGESANLVNSNKGIAIAFVGVGSLSMVTASISYSKKAKKIIN